MAKCSVGSNLNRQRHQSLNGAVVRSRLPEHRSLAHVKSRCKRPAYVKAGITVSPLFYGEGGPERFIEEIGPKPSLEHTVDRIDGTKGYVPGNIRWATKKEQGRNTKTTVMLTVGGEMRPLTEWAERRGISAATIHARLSAGASHEEAINRPLQQTSPRKENPISRSKEYQALHSARGRCCNPNNPNFPTYGGVGITIEKCWLQEGGFHSFLAHIGPIPKGLKRPSLDRIDGRKGYVVGNVRWVSLNKQSENRSSVITATICGVTKTLAAWARELDMPYETIRWRISAGMSPEESIEAGKQSRRERLVSFNGRTQSIEKWAKEYNISRDTLRGRLDRGWDARRSLHTTAAPFRSLKRP